MTLSCGMAMSPAGRAHENTNSCRPKSRKTSPMLSCVAPVFPSPPAGNSTCPAWQNRVAGGEGRVRGVLATGLTPLVSLGRAFVNCSSPGTSAFFGCGTLISSCRSSGRLAPAASRKRTERSSLKEAPSVPIRQAQDAPVFIPPRPTQKRSEIRCARKRSMQ
jgi:hypothetical protein